MATMVRAVGGTVASGIHMITFEEDKPTFVPDDAAVIEACRIAGCKLVEDQPAAKKPAATKAE